MLKIEPSPEGFVLYFKDKLILKHSQEKSFLSIGNGSGNFKVGGGVYKIKDTLRIMRKIQKYTIIENTKDLIILELDSLLKVIFTNKINSLEISFNDVPKDTNRISITLHAQANEHIFGCGEQYTHVDMKGKKVPLWIQEQGVGRGHDFISIAANLTHHGAGGSWHTTYFSQPTFVSSDNYCVHSDSTSYAEFDFRKKNQTTLLVWEIPKNITVFVEDSIPKIIENLTSLLGRQHELPDWVYDGVILGVQGGNELVAKKYNDAQKANIPVCALWTQDWEGRRITGFGKQLWWNWKFDSELYPDLPKEIQKYKKDGVRYLGYINSFLALEKDLYIEAAKKGYLVKVSNNEEIHVKVTTFPAAIIDLTNPQAFTWIKNIIKKNMIEIGLSGWMADFAEWLPTNAKLFSGENAEVIHNKYAMLWAKANYEAIAESGKLDEIMFFSRSGYSHSSKYSCSIWAGDQLVNFSKNDGLATVITSGISLGFNGIGLSHSDIGGYTSVGGITRTKEVFNRWAEQAVFTTTMRTHESNRPDTNWQFNSDSETLSHFSKMVRIHVALKPYIKSLTQEYSKTGLPPMRHMCIGYPLNKEVYKIKNQYLFGDDLLIAPVTKAHKKTWKAYIPDNSWISVWDHTSMPYGWNTVKAPIGRIPVFYKQNSKWQTLFETLKEIQ